MVRTRRRSPVVAAVDIGSYSVHLLVGRVHGWRIETVHDESAFLGLGRAIDEAGRIGAAGDRVVETLERYFATAQALEAWVMVVVATDPFRRAPDAPDLAARVQAGLGLEIITVSHEEEARIALIGVQAGVPIRRPTALVDVGGGSTEVLLAGPGLDFEAVGLPLGASRLTGVHVRHDPPLPTELSAMLAEASVAFARAPDALPGGLVAVGGTARSLLRLGPPLPNRTLSWRRIRSALSLAAEAPSSQLAERFGIRPSRAAVIPAGAAILLAAISRYGLDHLSVARGGLREGLVLARVHGGVGWRDAIGELALGLED
jgi:exopolyphosphatase/guanosine-5'-triphosphate,3'-diphosphate pyrophosphatase